MADVDDDDGTAAERSDAGDDAEDDDDGVERREMVDGERATGGQVGVGPREARTGDAAGRVRRRYFVDGARPTNPATGVLVVAVDVSAVARTAARRPRHRRAVRPVLCLPFDLRVVHVEARRLRVPRRDTRRLVATGQRRRAPEVEDLVPAEHVAVRVEADAVVTVAAGEAGREQALQVAGAVDAGAQGSPGGGGAARADEVVQGEREHLHGVDEARRGEVRGVLAQREGIGRDARRPPGPRAGVQVGPHGAVPRVGGRRRRQRLPVASEAALQVVGGVEADAERTEHGAAVRPSQLRDVHAEPVAADPDEVRGDRQADDGPQHAAHRLLVGEQDDNPRAGRLQRPRRAPVRRLAVPASHRQRRRHADAVTRSEPH